MPSTPKVLTRQQLASFLPNHEAVIAFETLMKQVFNSDPVDVTAINQSIDDLSIDSATANEQAQLALSMLQAIKDYVDMSSMAPAVPMVNQPYIRQMVKQIYAPAATGFSITVNPILANILSNVWLLLKPTADFAAGTIVLPPLATCVDMLTVTVSCTKAVTTLTTNGNGATVVGAPGALAANNYFTLRFDSSANTWYRVD